RKLAARLAFEKTQGAARLASRRPELAEAYIIGADTVVSVGRRILPKCETVAEAVQSLRILSGRAHRVHSAVCLLTPKGRARQKLVETRLRFKRLSADEIEAYLGSGEWRGKAGGYAIQGLAGGFTQKLAGSYPAVVGLPLYETLSLLVGEGFPAHVSWLNKV
ncbi:MAG: Maf family protein, partial [Beijerinckiaceae bacterium]|nr:Maf family protein [Beijerinckiaceae bacterium]